MVEPTQMPEQFDEDAMQPADGPVVQPAGEDDAFGADDLDGDDDELEGLTVVEDDGLEEE